MSKQPAPTTPPQSPARSDNLSALADFIRRDFLDRLIDPRRDIDAECGYPQNITLEQLDKLYRRSGIAARVVSVYPEETWMNPPEVLDNETPEKSEFEKQWHALCLRNKLWSYIRRVDELSGVGRYGVLLLGFDDNKPLNEALDGITDERVVTKPAKKHKLLYMRVFSEKYARISKFNTDDKSPRNGRPEEYQLDLTGYSGGVVVEGQVGTAARTNVHWSRILHVADNIKESEIYGEPRMLSVFDRLYDLKKVLGASGEGYWKGGLPGLSFETSPEMKGAELDVEALKRQFDAYSNGLQRYMATVGVTAKSIGADATEPTAWMDTYILAICIAIGVPVLVFTGSQSAKVTGAADVKMWGKRVAQRQISHAEPNILRPLIDRLISAGTLPQPMDGTYSIVWPDLNSPSADDRATIAQKTTQALAQYVGSGVDSLVPPFEYLTQVCGFTDAVATRIVQASEEYQEDPLLPDDLDGTQTPMGGVGAGALRDEPSARKPGTPKKPKY